MPLKAFLGRQHVLLLFFPAGINKSLAKHLWLLTLNMIDRRLFNQLWSFFFFFSPKNFLWALYAMYTRNKWTGFGKSSIWPVRLLRLYLHIFAKTLFCLLNGKNNLTACEKHGIMSYCDVFLRRDFAGMFNEAFSCLTEVVFYGIHKGPYFILLWWKHFQATWCNMDKLLTRTNTDFMTSSDQNIDHREWKGLCVGQSGASVAIIISNQSNDSQSSGCKRTKPADEASIFMLFGMLLCNTTTLSFIGSNSNSSGYLTTVFY